MLQPNQPDSLQSATGQARRMSKNIVLRLNRMVLGGSSLFDDLMAHLMADVDAYAGMASAGNKRLMMLRNAHNSIFARFCKQTIGI